MTRTPAQLTDDLAIVAILKEAGMSRVGLAREIHRLRRALKTAGHALRSYQYGNGSPDLAKDVADELDAILSAVSLQPKAAPIPLSAAKET